MNGSRTARLVHGLELLVLAIVAIAAAGLLRPARIGDPPAAIAHAVVHHHVARWGAPRPTTGAQDTIALPSLQRDAAFLDVGDDDLDDDDVEHRGELRLHVTDRGALALDIARLARRPGSTMRGHPQFDRSRFATGRGLLRGPPA